MFKSAVELYCNKHKIKRFDLLRVSMETTRGIHWRGLPCKFNVNVKKSTYNATNEAGNDEQRKEFHRFQMYPNTSCEVQARNQIKAL